jgi:hypothetical protein
MYLLPRIRTRHDLLAGLLCSVHPQQGQSALQVCRLFRFLRLFTPFQEIGFSFSRTLTNIMPPPSTCYFVHVNQNTLRNVIVVNRRRPADVKHSPAPPASIAGGLSFLRCGGASPPATTRSRKTHVTHRRMKIERVYRPYLTATEAARQPTTTPRGLAGLVSVPKSCDLYITRMQSLAGEQFSYLSSFHKTGSTDASQGHLLRKGNSLLKCRSSKAARGKLFVSCRGTT